MKIPSNAPNQKPQALVVGINKYEYKQLKNLQVPTDNAKYMANRLIKEGDFEVELFDAITRKSLKEHIVQLFKPKGQHPEMGLLYFSGYVLVKDEGIKEVFLATSESDPSKYYELGVSLRWLKNLLEESLVEQQIVILDCCYHEEHELHIDNLIPGYQNGIDRFFLIYFNKNIQYFLHENKSERVCTPFTNAILNILKLDESQEINSVDNRALIQKLKERYENNFKRNGYYKRISFGKRIDILGKPSINRSKATLVPVSGINQRKNPYKGLAFFDSEDGEYFFGRQKLTDELLEKVRNNNFLAVLGATGSGKSSVIKAGLIYKLKQGEQISGSENWKIIALVPGISPLESLAEQLAKDALIDIYEDYDVEFPKKIAEAKKYIEQGSNGLAKLIRNIDTKRVVLVLDQFEEAFILCENKKDREKFFECLLNASEKVKNNKLCLVLSLRADFFGKCAEQEYYGLARKIQQHLVAVTPMNPEELVEAIKGPAKELGVDVDDDFTKKLVDEVRSEPGSLPLLQYTLEQNWEENNKFWKAGSEKILRDKTNKSLNIVIEEHANNVYNNLRRTEKVIARYIFLKLTFLGEGTGDTRKKIKANDLINTSRYHKQDITRVTQKLIEDKLISSYKTKIDDGKEIEYVNLVHDALIRHWSQLRVWLNEYRVYSKFREDIQEKAEKWEDKDRDKSYLYTGEELKEAEKSIENYGHILTLNELAQNFLKASIDYRDEVNRKDNKLNKEKRRNRLTVILLILLLPILIFSIIAFDNLSSQKARTEQNKTFLSNQSVALTNYSKSLFSERQQFDALIEGLRAVVPLNKQKLPVPKNIKPVLRQAVEGVKERNRLEGHTGSIYNLGFSPDGKILASASLDKTIKLWNVETGKEILPRLKKHKRKVYNVVFNPQNSQQLASSSADGTIRLWNLVNREYQELTGHQGEVYSLSFSNDGKTLVSSSLDKTIKLWNVETGKQISTLIGHKSKVHSIDFNPQDNTQLVSGSADGTVQLWNLETGESKILSKRNYNVLTVHFSPDGKKLASGSIDGTVHIWNLETNQEFNTRSKHKNSVNSVIFNLDSTTLASGSSDNTIKLWDVATGREITTITGHKDWVYNLSFNPKKGKNLLASSSADGIIRLWDIDKIQSITTLRGHRNWVNSVIFNPQNDQQLASASIDGSIKIWDIATGKKRTISTKYKRINDISFSADGKILASSSADGSIQLWDTQTLQEIKPPLAGHQNWVNSLSFNLKDSTKLASASNDETIKVWNTQTGKLIYPPLKGRSEFNAVSFSSDGEILAAASFDNTIKLWNAKTGEKKITLEGHKNKVSSISFSTDNKFLVSGSYDKTVKIWYLKTGEVIHTLTGHTRKVESVSFSPNSNIVASGSADKTIKLWDTKTGKEIKTFPEHQNDVLSVNFNSDGTILASGSADETIILWKIPTKDKITSAENVNLNRLISLGCDWARGYLQNNPNVPENDKHLCDNNR
ncbi:MAG: caspase family protein [Cyanobacteria bacterium J06633_8]